MEARAESWRATLHRNVAFTHNGFDDQERNLTFIKMDFQVLKLKFHVCILSCIYVCISILFINQVASRDLNNTKIILYKFFVR